MKRKAATQRVMLGLGVLTLSLTLACGTLGQSSMANDLAKTAMDIERIYELNADTQKTVETRLKALDTRQQTQSDLLMRSLTDLEQRVATLQESLDAIRTQIDQLRYKAGGESAESVPLRVGQGDTASTVVLQGEQLFLEGQRAIQRKDYAGARASYLEFLKQFPSSPRGADAQMWLGETYYREGKWAEARAAFLTVEQRYVTSPRVPEAMMKVALCDRALGQVDQAAATLEQLIAKFPRWEQIEQAQEMLRTLVRVTPQLPPGPGTAPAPAPPTPGPTP